MDINEIQDTRTSFDRVGDRSYSTTEKKIKCLLVAILIFGIGYLIASQIQEYLQSFATTKKDMVEKFYPIENVPEWRAVVTKK